MEKYDVISVVGEGSYGLVMRCRHRESGQYVAIKKFLETEDDPTVRKMAMREIRMLKKLRHENLVNMIEVFRRKKRFFLVFEYLEHTVLEELEARSGGLGFITSRKYIYQVLRALDFIHSNNVIHRDIKPENVLVSRLGVIKLCDFGFARPYAENETFTDYVATRWYRSPELLVGDPRYGKEVDIWATGCLYAEMMTGEPLFPGESDVDQLFQIVRVLGKVNTRHQLLITRNTLFKGMKQEQNSSLSQLFPDWNRDSLDFLNQCLKMDGSSRPDTVKLLKHDLFVRDDFVEMFLPELRSKLGQELHGNPLLKRIQGFATSRKSEERKSSNGSITFTDKVKESVKHGGNVTKDKVGQIGLSLSQVMVNANSHPATQQHPEKTHKLPESGSFRSSQGSDELNLNLAHYKHYLTSQHNKNLYGNHKPININTLTFGKENNNSHGQQKYGARILSAKPQKSNVADKANANGQNSNGSTLEAIHIQPPSPVQFQSLQHENVSMNSNYAHLVEKSTSHNSPLTVNNLTLNGSNLPTYFANKRSTNILSNFQRPPINQVISNASQISSVNKHSPSLTLGVARSNLIKRDRGLLLDVGHLPYGMVGSTPESMKTEPSPRVLAPPAWLMGNVKVSSLGKTTQIGKRGLTDWKSVSQNNPGANNDTSDLVLPNCPGASGNTSPVKNMKKKLAPMTTMLPPGALNLNTEANIFPTPRISASPQKGKDA